ncbi:ABC transporter substrate-binding protein [Peterkaempfera bronchialis]|uniref:ABC transporter substrate-binding protein n=1 Tax=Peterkaempfera bronchialis TaxID=2126346 RepID=UPI003C2D99B2
MSVHHQPSPLRPDGMPTRRRLLGSAAGAAALLGLAACGSGGSGGSGSKGAAGASAGASAATTRVVDTAKGKVTVPARPQRVVILNDFPMAAMFDLGQLPVGLFNAGEEYVAQPYLERWRSIPKVSNGVGGTVEVEKVAALQPDLIIGIDAQPNLPYEQLSRLAPTVLLPFSKSKTPWRDMAEQTAVVLGLPDALAKLKQRYADRAAQIRKERAAVLARYRWALLQGGFDEGQWWLYGPESNIGGILAAAGARFSSGSVRVKEQASVSYELVTSRLSDADAIFYYTTNDGKPANLGPKLFAQQSFQKLPAVRAGHLYGSIAFLPAGYTEALMALDDFDSALRKL